MPSPGSGRPSTDRRRRLCHRPDSRSHTIRLHQRLRDIRSLARAAASPRNRLVQRPPRGVRETARLLAAQRLRAPDEAGVLAFPVRKFAFGRADTWFRVDRA